MSLNRSVRAVWVTFDRGRDITKFYSDPEVVAFVRRHDLALMMPHQCPAKNAPGGQEEMDMGPSHGVGRAIFTALDQFAHQTGHSELASPKLILLGFSGTGALFAHFVGYAPIVLSLLFQPIHATTIRLEDNVHLQDSFECVRQMFTIAGLLRHGMHVTR
ncbi:MAG TPA: hypothetical protein VK578_21250 [Edaphobacter sp.]|nr:hypothetical protein [Edaphobacter sp.]